MLKIISYLLFIAWSYEFSVYPIIVLYEVIKVHEVFEMILDSHFGLIVELAFQ